MTVTATITAYDADSIAARDGACDATIHADGAMVGKCTLMRDHEGNYTSWGVGLDHWASDQLVRWLCTGWIQYDGELNTDEMHKRIDAVITAVNAAHTAR